MEGSAQADILRRLAYICGHLEGIRRMAERDEPCACLLMQTYAVRKAIQTVELSMLEAHLRGCFLQTAVAAREGQAIELWQLFRRRISPTRRPSPL